mgnify:CR=1 FL=1
MDGLKHTKKILKDNNYYKLIEELGFNEDSYYIGENYTAFFCIINKLAIPQKLSFATGSPDEIKLNNASLLGKHEERKLEIRFNPISLGKKQFQLYIEPPRRMAKQRLLDKNFFVQEKPIINVEGYIKNPLSPTMALGKRGEVVFVFKNTGNRPITGVTIQVKEIKV